MPRSQLGTDEEAHAIIEKWDEEHGGTKAEGAREGASDGARSDRGGEAGEMTCQKYWEANAGGCAHLGGGYEKRDLSAAGSNGILVSDWKGSEEGAPVACCENR